MSTKVNQRDAAAEWSYKLAEDKRHKDFTCPDVAAAFLAGIQWAITHDPVVKGLVKALEYVKNYSNDPSVVDLAWKVLDAYEGKK